MSGLTAKVDLFEFNEEQLRAILEEGGNELKKKVDEKAKEMLQGPYTGKFETSVLTASMMKQISFTDDGGEAVITFEGTQHGNRNSEVAVGNEYGTKRQPARPFMWEATADVDSDKIVEKYLKI